MLRASIPSRSNPAQKKDYRLYKTELRADFGSRCGYCDTPDIFLGGRSVYHIDHFAPHSKFPHRKETYSNLIYACAFCNRSKSDKWVGNDPDIPNDGVIGFVDPCSSTYESHLDRDASGRFVSSTGVGAYMIAELKLSLVRHQHVWQSQRIKELRERLRVVKIAVGPKNEHYTALLEKIDELTQAYERFRDQIVDC
ncbi:hypothetical protein DXM27_07320 [Rhizobium rhizogenes]|uniref:HNH nuclease domain-containing protein n=1 Tax=Rhizobium rhizogenes TaxID=359 RepID=A0AA88F214_RHIRH|nr:hypothetical protein DXM27_07320 [Rhizobium rhizogenes]